MVGFYYTIYLQFIIKIVKFERESGDRLQMIVNEVEKSVDEYLKIFYCFFTVIVVTLGYVRKNTV